MVDRLQIRLLDITEMLHVSFEPGTPHCLHYAVVLVPRFAGQNQLYVRLRRDD